MSLLQDINRLTEEFIRLDHEQMEDPSINNQSQMDNIQFQLFMLSTKVDEEQQNLVDRLNYYREKYHQGQPVISDQDYDNLYFELVGLEHYKGDIKENSPTLANYDTLIQDGLKDVVHNLGRTNVLNATTLQEIIEFAKNKDIIAVVEPSGASCFLYYNNGYLIQAVTYGDGITGKDVTNNMLALTPVIPRRIPYTHELIVKGELTSLNHRITYEDLITYKSPQNLALNSIVSLDAIEFKNKNFLFFVTDIVKGFEDNVFYDKMSFLNGYGFFIAPTFFTSFLDNYIIEYLRMEADKIDMPFTNILFIENNYKYNDITHKILSYSYCQSIFERELRDIAWERFGDNELLYPVAVHDTIISNGYIKTRHSFFPPFIPELKKMVGTQPYIGQKMRIFRTNSLIPSIVDIDNPNNTQHSNSIIPFIPTYCPWCGQKLFQAKKYSLSDPDLEIIEGDLMSIQCRNPNCDGKFSNRIKYFCGKNGLNILNLSEDILQWLINKEWIVSFIDLYALQKYYKEWIIQPGFDKDIVDNILNSIEDSKQCSFSDFLSAMHIPTIDKNTINNLVTVFKTYDKFSYAIYFKQDIFYSPELQLNQEQIKSLLAFDYIQFDGLWNIFKYNQEIPYDKNYFYMPLRQKTYVVIGPTKYFDGVEWLCGYIHGEGGAVVTEVTENVNYVINNDPESDCPENIAARELGIPIITEQEFLGNIY